MLSFLAALAPAAASSASGNVSLSTEVVTAYSTYLPEPTTLIEGSQTFTVTAPTTLTVTDCPCTRTHTYQTSTVTVCPTSSSGVAPSLIGGDSNSNSNSTAPILPNKASSHGVSIAAAVGAAFVAAQLL